jgi:hypothetical protein
MVSIQPIKQKNIEWTQTMHSGLGKTLTNY